MKNYRDIALMGHHNMLLGDIEQKISQANKLKAFQQHFIFAGNFNTKENPIFGGVQIRPETFPSRKSYRRTCLFKTWTYLQEALTIRHNTQFKAILKRLNLL